MIIQMRLKRVANYLSADHNVECPAIGTLP